MPRSPALGALGPAVAMAGDARGAGGRCGGCATVKEGSERAAAGRWPWAARGRVGGGVEALTAGLSVPRRLVATEPLSRPLALLECEAVCGVVPKPVKGGVAAARPV
jgi:hypothetical protein